MPPKGWAACAFRTASTSTTLMAIQKGIDAILPNAADIFFTKRLKVDEAGQIARSDTIAVVSGPFIRTRQLRRYFYGADHWLCQPVYRSCNKARQRSEVRDAG